MNSVELKELSDREIYLFMVKNVFLVAFNFSYIGGAIWVVLFYNETPFTWNDVSELSLSYYRTGPQLTVLDALFLFFFVLCTIMFFVTVRLSFALVSLLFNHLLLKRRQWKLNKSREDYRESMFELNQMSLRVHLLRSNRSRGRQRRTARFC